MVGGGRQPALHRLVTCLRAPTAVLSGPDGQLRSGGAAGVLHADVRVLSELVLTVDGREPVPVGHALAGPAGAAFVAVLPGLGDPQSDPTVRLERHRRVEVGTVRETVRLVNDSRRPVEATVALRLGSDLAPIVAVRRIRAGQPAPPAVEAGTVRWHRPTGTAVVSAQPPPHSATADGTAAELSWRLAVPSHRTAEIALVLTADVPRPDTDPRAPVLVAAPGPAEWRETRVDSADRDLTALVRRSLADLEGLRMAPADRPGEAFAAAGTPWYFTLFGRDSLWTAQLLLPFGTELALGTLRVLAARQGRRVDPETGEQPGKILHEVRSGPPPPGGHELPPVYYGTIDATPLWVTLLHDAWRWGLPETAVRELQPALRAAVGWLTGHASGEDGFVRYVDASGRGLANQGWKDSRDAVQHPDGRIAEPPIALVEAQAYAHRALLDAAVLLSTLDGDGAAAERARRHAAELRDRFRAAFWVADEHGPFPALALDATGEPVASLASNLGHLPGTGLLDAAETALVAARLGAPDLDSGYGLRTLAGAHPSFNPLGYHTGSVWPHDTAIAVLAAARAGHPEPAAALARGLVAAGRAFDFRLPELFGGTAAGAGKPLLAYPAACRPQAWSAAAAGALLTAALGLRADVPGGELRVEPAPAFAAWFPLSVRSLRVAGTRLDVSVDAAGRAVVDTAARLTVHTGPGWDCPR
jgi:glycogen debranching enzyme